MRLLISRSTDGIVREVGEQVYRDYGGILITPRSGTTPERALELGAPWAIDNDAFSGFDARAFTHLLFRLEPFPKCQFVVAPDVVGNAYATIEQFDRWEPRIRALGYPVALALQNGAEEMKLPYERIDALFIGGDTTFKLSPGAARHMREARERGVWVHMGRVNSLRRVEYAASMGCQSVDGTGFARFSRDMMRRVLPALRDPRTPLFEF